MPFYEYNCDSCSHEFKQLLKIADRKKPEESPCQNCGENSVKQKIQAPEFSDTIRMGIATKSKDSGFKEVMQKIHNGVPGSSLDKSRILN